MFKWYDDQWSCVLPITNFSGTIAIALSFVFLAYILHPAVEKAYQKVRAYRGWRAIEANKTVEVSTYSLVSEKSGERRRWHAARIVAIVLAAFSAMSWGLEMYMNLPCIDDDLLDLFLRPLPMWKNETGDASYVIRPHELDIVEGEVPNMDNIVSIGTGNAMYKVNGESGIINGRERIASWDTDVENAKNDLFYDDNGEDIANVRRYEFMRNDITVDLFVEGGDKPWRELVDCNN